MKTKVSILAACVLASAAVLPVFSGCVGGFNTFRGEELESGEVRVNVIDGEGYVRWGKVDKAKGYRVYRSESRFGTYARVGDELIRGTQFKAEYCPYYYYKVVAIIDGVEVEIDEPVSAFSKNSLIISPTDDMQAVQQYIDTMHDGLESGSTGQFSSTRFAMMFLPGEYPQIEAKTGYYTSVMGLGTIPTEVTVGSLYVSTNVLSNNNSTCTFWRGVENIAINSDTQWAVSQATSMRRVQVNGNLALSHPTGWSSGGFLANSKITGTMNAGTQQQWMSRNDEWGMWPNNNSGQHNLVFSGCEGQTPASAWSESGGRYTNIEYTEKMAEKPFLYTDGAEYKIFVPDTLTNTKGITWENGMDGESGVSYSLDDFYLANALTDNSKTLNKALNEGKSILFTPGIYQLEEALKITKPDTVVMGMGYATLKIADGNKEGAIKIADVDGVRVAELLIDAGDYCDSMVEVGEATKNASHTDNPIVLSNIYLRIGGVENVHTETKNAMVIHANDTIGDNFWLWRGDHSRGVAWEDTENDDGSTSYGNPVQTGLLVNGDNVKCYALMVEHTEDYQTYWKGENGLTVMYQSETPYRVPSQEHWMSYGGEKNGCASYKVADEVDTHRAYGIGIYLVNYSGVNLASAIEVPEKEGIEMVHLVTCSFAATGGSTISNVINDYGGWVGATVNENGDQTSSSFRRLVEKYPLN